MDYTLNFTKEDLKTIRFLGAKGINELQKRYNDAELSVMYQLSLKEAIIEKLEEERVMLDLGTKYLWLWGLLVLVAGVLGGYYLPEAWMSKSVFSALFVATCTNLFFIGTCASKIVGKKVKSSLELDDEEEKVEDFKKALIGEKERIILKMYQPSPSSEGNWIRLRNISKNLPFEVEPKKLSQILKDLGFLAKRQKDGTKFLIKKRGEEEVKQTSSSPLHPASSSFTHLHPSSPNASDEAKSGISGEASIFTHLHQDEK